VKNTRPSERREWGSGGGKPVVRHRKKKKTGEPTIVNSKERCACKRYEGKEREIIVSSHKKGRRDALFSVLRERKSTSCSLKALKVEREDLPFETGEGEEPRGSSQEKKADSKKVVGSHQRGKRCTLLVLEGADQGARGEKSPHRDLFAERALLTRTGIHGGSLYASVEGGQGACAYDEQLGRIHRV